MISFWLNLGQTYEDFWELSPAQVMAASRRIEKSEEEKIDDNRKNIEALKMMAGMGGMPIVDNRAEVEVVETLDSL